MEHWYTLQTRPQTEYRVAQLLKQRGLITFLPEIDVAKQDAPLKTEVLFPGYLFMRVDLEEVSLAHFEWLPGLKRIIAFGGTPVFIPDRIMAAIQERIKDISKSGDDPKPLFTSGQSVEILEGPFKGMQAIFESTLGSQQRVQILIEILGAASRVQLSPKYLKPTAKERDGVGQGKRSRLTRGRGRRIKQRAVTG